MQIYKVKVLRNETFKEEACIIETEKPNGLSFKAGQFMMIHNDKEKRAFSIASPPSYKSLLFLVKKHVGGKVSPVLHELKSGNQIEMSGPYGIYTTEKAKNGELIFIAAGTGIAPFLSMIQDSLEKESMREITLLFGFRKDCYFENEFRGLASKYKNFKFLASCSEPNKNWSGLTGRITKHIKEMVQQAEGKDFFIIGPKEMISDTERELHELKVKKENVHIERW